VGALAVCHFISLKTVANSNYHFSINFTCSQLLTNQDHLHGPSLMFIVQVKSCTSFGISLGTIGISPWAFHKSLWAVGISLRTVGISLGAGVRLLQRCYRLWSASWVLMENLTARDKEYSGGGLDRGSGLSWWLADATETCWDVL
jgi:hypothetical protein